MNVLIVADKVNGKVYTEIINKLNNTKVIGVVNTVSEALINDIEKRYTPNVIIIDTAVDYNNILPSMTELISNTYNYIKIVVLAEADEDRIFPSASIIKGSISSTKLAELLSSDNDTVISTPIIESEKSKGKTNSKKLPQKFKVKRNKRRFKFNPMLLIPIAFLIVIIVVSICAKSCKSNSNPSQINKTTNQETIVTSESSTMLDITAADRHSAVTVATVAGYTQSATTITIATVNNNEKSESISENNISNSNDNNSSKSNQSNEKKETNSNSQSYVTVSKPEYNYSNNENKDIEVNGISLNYLSKTLSVGDSVNLSATVTPSNATNKTVSWSTSNSSVATVNNGYVISHSVGTAYITVTAGNYKATCTVIVKEKETQDSVYITPSSKTCGINEVITFTLVNAENCSFNISNPTVVQIIGGGSNRIQIKTKSKATVTITATDNSTDRRYTAKLIVE